LPNKLIVNYTFSFSTCNSFLVFFKALLGEAEEGSRLGLGAG
jgi:hypothetical protein